MTLRRKLTEAIALTGMRPPLTVSGRTRIPLRGKRVLITGSSSGIGEAGAEQFAALSLGPPAAPEPIQARTIRWVEQRIGRQTATPPLEYATSELILQDSDDSLADLLRAPLRQVASMQK